MSDTTPEARKVQMDAFRSMTPERRVEMAVEMSEDLADISETGHLELAHRLGCKSCATPLVDEDDAKGCE